MYSQCTNNSNVRSNISLVENEKHEYTLMNFKNHVYIYSICICRKYSVLIIQYTCVIYVHTCKVRTDYTLVYRCMYICTCTVVLSVGPVHSPILNAICNEQVSGED